MKNFTLYKDMQCTVWVRETYTVEAETAEEAKKFLIENDASLQADDYETLLDTVEYAGLTEIRDESGELLDIIDYIDEKLPSNPLQLK